MWKLYSRNRMMTIHSQMGRWKRARLLYSAFALSVILPGRYGIISSDPWTVSPTATDTLVRTFKRIHQPVSHHRSQCHMNLLCYFFLLLFGVLKVFFFLKRIKFTRKWTPFRPFSRICRILIIFLKIAIREWNSVNKRRIIIMWRCIFQLLAADRVYLIETSSVVWVKQMLMSCRWLCCPSS